jgi:hypothetical protein
MVSQCVRCRVAVGSSCQCRAHLRWNDRISGCRGISCVTTCSISSSCIAFCPVFREKRPLVIRSSASGASPLGPWFAGQGGDRNCHPHRFDGSRSSFQVLIEFCSFVLRPFARNAFLFVRSSIATMASADSPRSLNPRVSPGRCLFFPFAPLGSTECRQ